MGTQPVPTLEITLPSRGRLYEGKIPDGKVTIRKMKTGELIALESEASADQDRAAVIIDNCTILPNKFPQRDLLMSDRFAILLALRRWTFPTAGYNFNWKCQHCPHINMVKNFDLGKLDCHMEGDAVNPATNEPWPTFVEPVVCMLPECGKKVELRFLRGTDEKVVAQAAKRMKNVTGKVEDTSLMHRLARQIVSIDDVKPTDIVQTEHWIVDLDMPDTYAMVDALDAVETGVNLKLNLDCQACQMPRVLGLPITADFFRPAASKR